MFKNDDLSSIFEYYRNEFSGFEERNVFRRFNELFKLDCSPINDWLQFQIDHEKIVKDNNLSTFYRKKGNELFCKKDLDESLKFYSKSLCYASQPSEEFSLALANRSAVNFEKEKFNDTLKDIELCLNSSNYPEHLKPKMFLRKAECLRKLNRIEDLQIFHKTAEDFLNSIKNEKFLEKLNKLKLDENFNSPLKLANRGDMEMFENNIENPDFIFASPKIQLIHSEAKGRQVVAQSKIRKGQTIFIEKSFCFTPIFNVETFELDNSKCYHCLQDIFSGLPCKTCVKCTFCNENCRNTSWSEYHKFECVGMQNNIWYHLGITQAAFRAFLKGFNSNLLQFGEYGKIEKFTDKNEEYLYFNSLIYHISNRNIENLIYSAILMKYLENYTDFLDGIELNQIKKFGGIIAKHILQLENNGSIIEHYKFEEKFPRTKLVIASGIFPSVSMMNHSCKPNITNFFIRDTIIVKAIEDIEANEEISNCYGIDYRFMRKEERRNYCSKLYNFECNCEICSDPSKELENLDKFKCVKCGKIIREISDTYCGSCKEKIDFELLKKIDMLPTDSEKGENNENSLTSCMEAREKMLNLGHSGLSDIYFELYNFYKENGINNASNMLKYLEKWVENEKLRGNGTSQYLASILYETGNEILEKKFLHLQAEAEKLLKDSKTIFNLHYPKYLLE